MNPMAKKKLSIIDSRFLGEVVQASIDLETVTRGQWLRLDGRDLNRSAYPELAKWFPVGVFTSTARTLAAIPGKSVLAADSTNFLTTGAQGTDALQASADGITWVTTTGGWVPGTFFCSIIVAGSRWVVSGQAESQSYVINTGGTAANLVVKANWTVTTAGGITTLIQGLAYSATANAGSGRTVMCKPGSLATASALFYLNDGATAWNAASGGSTMDRKGVVWTGQKFMAFCVTNPSCKYQTSADGATWADAFLPANGVVQSFASDGSGTVVVTMTGLYIGNAPQGGATVFAVTKDHGMSWQLVDNSTPDLLGLNTVMNFANGKFIAVGGPFSGMSANGLDWVGENLSGRGKEVANDVGPVAYKAGVYCSLSTTAAITALTATEDTSKFKLPRGFAFQDSGTSVSISGLSPQWFIKARSN